MHHMVRRTDVNDMIVSSTDINYDEQSNDYDVEYECPLMANLMNIDILS